jgi:LIVCS family branched-chain amino acid:cation transporter
MFFGSGNLVFPLQVGLDSGSNWLMGFVGLFLTGIVLPFLGLFVIKLHKGNYNEFFSEAGVAARVFLPLFTLSLLGSFGVVPRCITVAYGGLEYIFPNLPLSIFSLGFCVICFIMCLNDRYMITIMGKWLTPLLLISLGYLIILGIIQAPQIALMSKAPLLSMSNGFLQGYETMDLFAAFFFSSLIFKQIQTLVGPDATHREIIRFALKPSIVGAGILSVIYLGFVYLGAHYSTILSDVAPELILPTITSYLLGSKAVLLIGLIVVLSCLTTAVALNNVYARYMCTTLKLQESRFPIILFITTSISFCMSLLDFKGIAHFLSPLLEVSYPSLIALTFLSIILKGNKKIKTISFYGIMLLAILC